MLTSGLVPGSMILSQGNKAESDSTGHLTSQVSKCEHVYIHVLIHYKHKEHD